MRDLEIIDPKSQSIYKKGLEIYDLVRRITKLMPDNEEANFTTSEMHHLASLLFVKVAGPVKGP